MSASGMGGARGERGRAEQPQFLARPEVEDQVPAPPFLRERVGDAQHGRRAGRVVVGAAVHAPGLLLGRERHAVGAGPEMVVVRAERHPRLRTRRRGRRGRQIADDVAARPRFANDRRVHADLDAGQREARHVRVAGVERFLRLRQRLPRGAGCEQGRRDLVRDAERENAGARDRRVERHRRQFAGVRRVRPRDDEHRLRAVLPRGHRLVAQVGVARQDVARLLIRVLGEVAQHEHDLVLHVERGVAVVPEILALGHDDAVAGEDHGPAHVAVVRKGQGTRVGRRRRAVAPAADASIRRRVCPR